ncbi:MAG: hypothetical protein DMF66_03415 [Acidobacteria bacterium]|nr:MAG: hypothetical protein DMF66_03415 [Acidobacteriota bacterium]
MRPSLPRKRAGRLAQARGEKTLSEERNRGDLSEIIAENFGANATYVEGLLHRYRSNPSLVDEAWRAYFTELLGESAPATGDGGRAAGGNGVAAVARDEVAGVEQATAQSQATQPTQQAAQQETAATGAQAPTAAARQQTPRPAAAQTRRRPRTAKCPSKFSKRIESSSTSS